MLTTSMLTQLDKLFYGSQLTYQQIGDVVGLTKGRISQIVKERYHQDDINERKQINLCARSPKRTGVKYLHRGYKLVRAPEWWTGSVESNIYAREHQVNWCIAHDKTQPLEGMYIHHVDGNRLNNDVSNLEAMTPAEHSRLHRLNPNL